MLIITFNLPHNIYKPCIILTLKLYQLKLSTSYEVENPSQDYEKVFRPKLYKN